MPRVPYPEPVFWWGFAAFGLMLAASAVTLAGPPSEPDDGSALNLSDLAPYRAALEGRPEGKAVPASFRDLWDRPKEFQGRRVRVEGRVARRFRQGAYGTFPPLVEAWAASPAGDPFCLVYPETASDAARAGAFVSFEGVFLRRVRYRGGGDADRLAPLVVGDRVPTVTTAAPATPPVPPQNENGAGRFGGLSGPALVVGLLLALVVALRLALRHTGGQTPRRAPPEDDPAPDFIESS